MAGTGTWRKISNNYPQTTNHKSRPSFFLHTFPSEGCQSLFHEQLFLLLTALFQPQVFQESASFHYPAADNLGQVLHTKSLPRYSVDMSGKTLGLAVVTASHQDFPFLPGSKWFFYKSREHHIRMTPLKESFYEICKVILWDFSWLRVLFTTSGMIFVDGSQLPGKMVGILVIPCFRREKFDKYFRCWPKKILFTSLQYFEIHPKWWCSRILANSRGKWICWFMTWPLLETICPPELLQNINDFPYAWPPLPCIHHTWWYPSAKIEITPSSWTLQHCTYQLIHDTPKCYLNMIVNLCNCQTASILSIRIVSLNLICV